MQTLNWISGIQRPVLITSLTLVLPMLISGCGGDQTSPSTVSDRPISIQAAIGTDPVTGATLETDKDDYFPGDSVRIVGQGWAPSETVALHLTRDPQTSGDNDWTVVADQLGAFETGFLVVETDLGVTFSLTGAGPVSGSITTVVFTDGLVLTGATLNGGSAVTVAPSTSINASVSGNVTGGSGAKTLGSISVKAYLDGSSASTAVQLRCFDVIPNVVHTSGGAIAYTTPFTFDAPAGAGVYDVLVEVYASDDCTTAVSDRTLDKAITVQAASNQAPTADAGGPYSGVEGSAINLDGTGSMDDGTIATYAWTYEIVTADAGASCTISGASIASPTITCNEDGSYLVKLIVTDDNDAASTEASAGLTVTNANPTANAGGPYSGTEGSAIQLSGSGDDPGDNDDGVLTYEWSVTTTGIDLGGACNLSNTTAQNPTVTCTDDSGAGTFTVSLIVRDDDGGESVASTANLTVTNADPVASAGGPYSGDEGEAISLTGSETDAGSNDTHTFKWTWAPISGVDAGASCSFSPNDEAQSPSVTCTDDGTYKLTLTVTDDDLGTNPSDATLTLSNENPSVTIISPTAGALYSLLNGPIQVSATHSDAGSNDTHQCRFELAGATSVTGSYFDVAGGTCGGPVAAPEAGVYNLTVRVKDDDDGEGTATVMIVVYDPSAGFVTGGGWINSPVGAYVPDPGLTGKANFGFVSKYKKGANIPEGNTEFQFHAGGMNFHSSVYQWLVVNQAGTNAQFKGTGTLNGQSGYGFMLWASDGPDTFRIKIWLGTDENNPVYDNGVTQALGGGSIVIHTGGKKP